MKTAVWQDIKKAAHLKVLMEGSGDPADEHEIIGVAVFDAEGNLLLGMGTIEGEDEAAGQIPAEGGETNGNIQRANPSRD